MDGNICGNNAEAFNKDKLKCFGYSIYNESLYSGLLNTYFINQLNHSEHEHNKGGIPVSFIRLIIELLRETY